MLRGIRDQILHCSHDVVKESRSIDKFAEAWDLSRDSSSNFRLAVFEKLDESWDKIPCYDLVVYCLCNLEKVS